MIRTTKEEVVRVTCREFGIEPDMLKLRLRREPLPFARAVIAHLLYRELGMLPREILPFIGHMPHNRTVIYHYIGRTTLVERLTPYNKALREKLANINQQLTNTHLSPMREVSACLSGPGLQ